MAISSQQSVVSKEDFVLQRFPLEIDSKSVARNVVEGFLLGCFFRYKQRPSKSKRTNFNRKEKLKNELQPSLE